MKRAGARGGQHRDLQDVEQSNKLASKAPLSQNFQGWTGKAKWLVQQEAPLQDQRVRGGGRNIMKFCRGEGVCLRRIPAECHLLSTMRENTFCACFPCSF